MKETVALKVDGQLNRIIIRFRTSAPYSETVGEIQIDIGASKRKMLLSPFTIL